MEFAQLQAFMMVLLGICALAVAISGAAAAVTKYWRFAHKQSDENTSDIKELKEIFFNTKTRVDVIEKRQDAFDDMNKLQLKAMVTLLGHEIDGNQTAQLKDVRDEIHKYLIQHIS